MKKLLLFVLLYTISFSSLAAADSASQVFSDANSNAKAAQEFIKQAEKMLEGTPDRPKLELAISLYAKAGELFEKSYKIYATLGPTYVSKQDVEGAHAAMENCMTNINELRKRLQ